MQEKEILTINIIKLKQHIQFSNKTKEYNFKQQIKRANDNNLIKQLYNLCIKLIDNKPLETYNSPENIQIKDDLIDSERKNNKLEKEIERLNKIIDYEDKDSDGEYTEKAGYKQRLEEFKNTRKNSKRNRELLDRANQELMTKDNIISGLNRDIDMLNNNNNNNTKQSITTLKPNININIEEDKEDKSIFDCDNISDISDMEGYDPYSEDNIDPASAPSLDEFTENEIDEAREICGYEAWNELTDIGKLQFLLEKEN